MNVFSQRKRVENENIFCLPLNGLCHLFQARGKRDNSQRKREKCTSKKKKGKAVDSWCRRPPPQLLPSALTQSLHPTTTKITSTCIVSWNFCKCENSVVPRRESLPSGRQVYLPLALPLPTTRRIRSLVFIPWFPSVCIIKNNDSLSITNSGWCYRPRVQTCIHHWQNISRRQQLPSEQKAIMREDKFLLFFFLRWLVMFNEPWTLNPTLALEWKFAHVLNSLHLVAN